MPKQITIEEKCAFSQSQCWQQSQQFYKDMGVTAWAESVPFYITSNAFIGKQYATILMSAMQDWVEQHKQVQSCFDIVEIGAGSGQLALYIMQSLNELLEVDTDKDINYRYIVTDLSQKNLDFVAQHPAFQQQLQSGRCRLAKFDCINDKEILLQASHNLPAEKLARQDTPLMCIANYLFDSLPADVFHINNHTATEALVSLSTSNTNLKKGHVVDWKKVGLNFSHAEQEKKYDNKHWGSILQHYAEKLSNSYVLFPTCSLKTLATLLSISHNNMMLMTSDKCFTDTAELDEQEAPELDVHGSLSTMVNLHAMTEYWRLCGGTSFVPIQRDGLSTAVMTIGTEHMPRLEHAITTHVEGFSATDFFNLYEQVAADPEEWSLAALSSILALSNWDPGLFHVIGDVLLEKIQESDSQVIDFIISNLEHVADRFYPIVSNEDVYHQIANIYYEANDFKQALKHFIASDRAFPGDADTLYNIGLCQQEMDDHHGAIHSFEKALELSHDMQTCKQAIKESRALI